MSVKYWVHKQKISLSLRLRKMMKCICSGEQLRMEDIIPSSESLATRDYSASGYSSRAADDAKADTSNIEEAESSLRESGILNYEEARALLGRLEYQKGNIEAALHVFEGIDIAAVVPKLKLSIARRGELPRRNSLSDAIPPMSMHAVSLLFEAILLKATSLQALGRFTEAAQSCTVILDTVESALPDGLPENFSTDCKLLETLNKAVELLPELWKLACAPQEAILSYRRALLYCWNLDVETRSKIEKEYAVFLLYSGTDAAPPNLRAQAEGSFIPRNNIEEAILLLLVLLRRYILNKIVWDPSILDHLSFALSIAGRSRAIVSDSERTSRLCEALESLDSAHKMTGGRNPSVLFYLSLENAEQRKLDIALYYAKQLLKLEGGSTVKGWLLLARILSAQKRYIDAESIINAALDETGKWNQGELLRTKAKLQIAQGHLRDAVETYTHLLAVLQVQRKSFGVQKKLLKNMRNNSRSLEMETWHDLANVYTNLSQWRDAEVCLIKSEAINPHSASRCHSTGLFYQARGLYKEALQSFQKSLDIEPNHVPSLVSTAIVLRHLDGQSLPVMKSFLTEALRLDRTNPSAWYNLGLVYKSENGASALEAAECFEAAELLQESAPVEPFR